MRAPPRNESRSLVKNEETPRLLSGPRQEPEQAAASQLLTRVQAVKGRIARFERIAGKPPPPRSVMGVDDRVASPVLFSTIAGYALTVAVDNLKGLIALLESGDGITLYAVAQYPLIRSAIESAAVATWLLGPEDRRTRMLHLLQTEMDGLIYDARLIKRVSLVTPEDSAEERRKRNQIQRAARRSHEETKESLAAIASRHGIAFEEYEKGQPTWMTLIEEATQWAYVSRADMGPTTWMALSGLTHPSTTRGLMSSVVEEFEPPVDDLHTVRLSGSVQSVNMGIAAALIFLNRAEELNRRRRLQVDGSPDRMART